MFVQKDFDLIGFRGQDARQFCGTFDRRAMDRNGLIQVFAERSSHFQRLFQWGKA